jgi:hypothetical protein
MAGKAENKMSEKGMPKREDRGQAGKGSVKSEERVGGGSLHFPVHNYHGMEGCKTPGK